MEGGTMRKEVRGSANNNHDFSKTHSGYRHQSHHHQRSPSMESNGHQHMHSQQSFPKSRQLSQQPHEQQYHPKGPSHYHRNDSRVGGYTSYQLPPGHGPNHLNHYHPHYGMHPRATTPGVRSVVTHSFSMEEEQREDGSSRYHRSQNQREANSYPRDEYRSPPSEFHPDRSSQPQQRDPQNHAFEPPPPLPPYNSTRPDYHYGNGRDLPPVLEEHEGLLPPRGVMQRPADRDSSERVPPSPHNEVGTNGIERSLSSVSASGPLKRSFWHHSRPVKASNVNEGSMQSSSLPSEFLPPKRSKTTGSSDTDDPSRSPKREKEYIVTARSQSSPHREHQRTHEDQEHHQHQRMHDMHGGQNGISPLGGVRASPPTSGLSPSGPWYDNRCRSMSWEAREDHYRRDPRSTPSWASRSPNGRDGPAQMSSGQQHWMEAAPYMPSPRGRYGNEANHYEMPLQSWEASPRDWGHHHHQPHSPHLPYLAWSGGTNSGKGREETEEEKKYNLQSHGIGSYENEQQAHHMFHGAPQQPHGMGPMMGPPIPVGSPGVESPSMMKARSQDMIDNEGREMSKSGPIKLLALPEDRISLSETLCIVRENVEVFTATIEDVEAPAPGRKHAVTVGQVGLRCIHCRHTTRSSERVKRAVCYPSSIKRIYRTVIDMKLDHFLHCKFVPQNLKDTLQALKANNTRSTGTTMQYFIRAATSLGMVDGPSGVRIANSTIPTPAVSLGANGTDEKSGTPSSGKAAKGKDRTSASGNAERKAHDKNQTSKSPNLDLRIKQTSSTSSDGAGNQTSSSVVGDVPSELFTGKVPLSIAEDKMSLSPLRCFLREQVCAFSATEEDIAVRTPTTFAVSVGQVGIGCIHCMGQPAKLRLNRAVCFPFSITRIYQSVADIQRFHLGECKLVPKDVKEKFLELQSQSSKGSKGLATRQYWVTSAKKIGLVDTTKGIRFCRDPAIPEKKAVSLDILAQVASNVTTVNKPLVLPEDKPHIAEFLFVVMSQLQPCRFTEADRNKRRLKDVGCIGVECKHCAGQVDGRKFFWSSVNAVESNFVSVHTHMMECRMVPKDIKENLGELKKLRKQQTAALKTGSQKSFFARVWKRLHEEPEKKEKPEEKKNKEGTKPLDNEDDDATAPRGTTSTSNTGRPPDVVESTSDTIVDDVEDPVVKASFSVCLSQDTLDSTLQITPASSPAVAEKPFTEISMGVGSPDSNQKIEAVSDKMADVRV